MEKKQYQKYNTLFIPGPQKQVYECYMDVDRMSFEWCPENFFVPQSSLWCSWCDDDGGGKDDYDDDGDPWREMKLQNARNSSGMDFLLSLCRQSTSANRVEVVQEIQKHCLRNPFINLDKSM